jgi:hypothetical protein
VLASPANLGCTAASSDNRLGTDRVGGSGYPRSLDGAGHAALRMKQQSWPALHETCYFPVDLLHRPGRIKVTRTGHNSSESAQISVEPFKYGTQEIELGDIPQANPS